MALTKNKLTQYQKQCKAIEKLYKSSGNKKDISQLTKQRKEAEKLLQKLRIF